MQPKISVGLPIFKSREIAWLAFEGLIRQNVNVKWELIIAEEKEQAFGAERVKEYVDRLRSVGCTVRYFELDYWIPLSQKWKFLFSKVSDSSEAFIFQAADCFAEPNRLQSAYDSLKKYDWVHNRTGYFYSVSHHKCIKFDQASFGKGCKTGINTAVTTRIIDRIEHSHLESGIDNWLLNTLAPKNILWREGEQIGVNTDGLNRISLKRSKYFNKPVKPFNATDKTLEELVPKEVADMLTNTRGR